MSKSTARKQEAQEAAEKRTVAWRKLSPQQQLEALDWRLGANVGADKQRVRLLRKIWDEEHKK